MIRNAEDRRAHCHRINLIGRATQTRKREQRVAEYSARPRLCEGCNGPIGYDQRLTNRFCSQKCYGSYGMEHRETLTLEHRAKISAALMGRRPAHTPQAKTVASVCGLYGQEVQRPKAQKYCSLSCSRRGQLRHEEAEADKLRALGYEVFSPTVVCDRVAVKNGRVYFVEFKPPGDTLRAGQARIQALVPEMYVVVEGEQT